MARTRDKEKPAQIIEAAFAVFGDVGYEATVIKDIAERAGISSGTIYTYFSDKRDLFRATALEGWSRFLQQIREIAESGAPADARIRQVIEIGFRNLKNSLPLLRGMLFESSQMKILQQSLLELCRLLEQLFAERARCGSPPDRRSCPAAVPHPGHGERRAVLRGARRARAGGQGDRPPEGHDRPHGGGGLT